MARRKQVWKVGDVFAIGAQDGSFCAGQIIGHEAALLNSATIALFEHRSNSPSELLQRELTIERAFSLMFVTRDQLDAGAWQVVGDRPVSIDRSWFPYEATRAHGWIGARVIGTKIVQEFVDAYFGLVPWDDWQDPEYLDKLLLPSRSRPANVSFKRAR